MKQCATVLSLALALSAFGKEVKVSSFGFDAADSTRFLQAALDSDADRVVVDRQAGPWVTKPLFGRRSNVEIVFERGVELVAKKGEFRGRNDCLVKFVSVTNVTVRGYGATWRMHRADYDAAPYAKGEWRHSLSLLSAENVLVEGLTLVESGGDGVYVADSSRTRQPCRNIVLRDLVCDRHYRQGISVITVDGLLIERCKLTNTWGTPPAAGIDFEPNAAHEELADIVMRDCEIFNNQGCGIEFYLGQLDASTRPVSVKIENCRSHDNAQSGFFLGFGKKSTFTKGTVSVRNCTFENEKGAAVRLVRKPKEAVSVDFASCAFVNCGSEVELHTKMFGDAPVDGFSFTDCTFKAPVERPRIVRRGRTFATGDLPPAVAFDARAAKPFDREPGKLLKLAPLRLRHTARYRFYVDRPGRAEFVGRSLQLGRAPLSDRPIVIKDAAGNVLASIPPPKSKADLPFSFDAPAAGFYLIEVSSGNHAFHLVSSTAAVALEVVGGPQSVLSSEAKAFFRVTGNKALAIGVAGADNVERVHAIVRDPSGTVVWDKDRVLDWEVYRTPSDAAEGLWSVELKRPTNAPYEDVSLMILGGQPEFFLSAERGW